MEFRQDVSMAAPSRAVIKRRTTSTALPLYFSGQMQKKYTGEGGFKSYHGELRGSTMFFYINEKQETYSERLELHNLRSMEPVSSYSDCTAPIYTLKFPNQEVQLKMDNPDAGELWRGYILTVAKLEVPHQLQLLPGQFMRLQEVQDQEQQRRVLQPAPLSAVDVPASHSGTQSTSAAIDDDTQSMVPSCYVSVSREEAEKLLEQNPEYGSIIVRPATDKHNFSITTRQIFPSGPVIKNYKVLASDAGYTIQLDAPVTVPTLNHVVDYFVEKTGYKLKPFVNPKPYDTCIDRAATPLLAPKPKVLPRARVAPTIHTQPPPPPRPAPTPPLLKQTSEYENDDLRKTPDDEKKKKKT